MFTTSCFIRKNTFTIRVELSKLGYENSSDNVVGDAIATSQVTSHYTTINQKMYDDFNPHSTWSNNRIDCGDNEELFLALAALRDDTNENQWFIAQETMWDENYNGEITVYYEKGEWLLWNEYSLMEDMPSDFKKATVDELIEHFKK